MAYAKEMKQKYGFTSHKLKGRRVSDQKWNWNIIAVAKAVGACESGGPGKDTDRSPL